jgi:CBS domain-containing protein
LTGVNAQGPEWPDDASQVRKNVTGDAIPVMKVREVMSSPAVRASPWDPIRTALVEMRDNDIGALPVVAGGTLIGIVTDRDIARGMLTGATQHTPVREVMTRHPATCRTDETLTLAAARMGDRQVRRLPVLDEAGQVVGLLSLCDIAENVSEELAGQTLGEICEDR